MGQLAQPIHDAALAIPSAPVADPADLLTGPELLAIFAKVEVAIDALDLRGMGSRIQRGVGAPDNLLGNDLDLYLNTANGDLYGKDAGAWSFLLNLRGPQGMEGKPGATGQTGDTGPRGGNGSNGTNGTNGTNGNNGADGNRISAPAAAPAPSDGNLGDLAIVAATGDLQEKTSSGWVTRGNLKGPKGDTGATGSNGTSSTTSGGTNSGTGGHTILANGTQLAAQTNLDFIGDNVTGENDATTSKTKIKFSNKVFFDTLPFYNYTDLPTSYFDACTITQVRKTGGLSQVTLTINSSPTTLLFTGDLCDLSTNPISIPAGAIVSWSIVYTGAAYFGTLRAKINLS